MKGVISKGELSWTSAVCSEAKAWELKGKNDISANSLGRNNISVNSLGRNNTIVNSLGKNNKHQ